MDIPLWAMPAFNFVMKAFIRIKGIPFVLKLKWLNFRYGKGNVPQEKLSAVLSKHMSFDDVSMKQMFASAATVQILERFNIPMGKSYFFYLYSVMIRMEIETKEEQEFANNFHNKLIHEKPLRRAVLNAMIRYRDINLSMIEKTYPAEQRAEFEEWLSEQ